MIPSTFGEKSLLNFGPLSMMVLRPNHTHPNRLLEDHISALKGCCAPKFLRAKAATAFSAS